jgi:hypothetical protein
MLTIESGYGRFAPLASAPQEFFVLTTDEHRWTQIFRGFAKSYPSRRGGTPWAWHSVGRPKGFFICVDLCESVVKEFPAAPPEKPANSFTKICKNPSKNPDRQPSSTLKIFLAARPPLPNAPAASNHLRQNSLHYLEPHASLLQRVCRSSEFNVGPKGSPIKAWP